MSNSTSNSYFSCRGWFREILRIHFLQVYLVVIVPTFSKPTGPFFIRLKAEPVIVCLLVVGDVPEYHGVQFLSYLVFITWSIPCIPLSIWWPTPGKVEVQLSCGSHQICTSLSLGPAFVFIKGIPLKAFLVAASTIVLKECLCNFVSIPNLVSSSHTQKVQLDWK